MKYFFMALLFCAIVFINSASLAAQASGPTPKENRTACLKVFVSLKVADKNTYSYEVKNVCAKESFHWNQLRIGQQKWNGDYELKTLATTSKMKSPANWKARAFSTEESETNNSIQWSNSANPEVKPGQGVSGFKVTLDTKDDTYKTAHWTIIFNDSTDASGKLEVK